MGRRVQMKSLNEGGQPKGNRGRNSLRVNPIMDSRVVLKKKANFDSQEPNREPIGSALAAPLLAN